MVFLLDMKLSQTLSLLANAFLCTFPKQEAFVEIDGHSSSEEDTEEENKEEKKKKKVRLQFPIVNFESLFAGILMKLLN